MVKAIQVTEPCTHHGARGGYVVAVERGFVFTDAELHVVESLPSGFTDESVRLNEGGCDSRGRFYCGSRPRSRRPPWPTRGIPGRLLGALRRRAGIEQRPERAGKRGRGVLDEDSDHDRGAFPMNARPQIAFSRLVSSRPPWLRPFAAAVA
jgi:hypothetical protein